MTNAELFERWLRGKMSMSDWAYRLDSTPATVRARLKQYAQASGRMAEFEAHDRRLQRMRHETGILDEDEQMALARRARAFVSAVARQGGQHDSGRDGMI